MDDKETLRVGVAVRRLRRSLGLTLAVVAERSGLSVPFLSQVENERARPSARSLQRVADALNTTVGELYDAADCTRTVDVVRAEPEGEEGPACGLCCADTTSCTPWSSPASRTPVANSSTATTS